jgi:uncharacterized membrane protein YozB (DUF420 family)
MHSPQFSDGGLCIHKTAANTSPPGVYGHCVCGVLRLSRHLCDSQDLMRGFTPFGGEGVIRNVIHTMLISHIILAIVIVPLVIVTLRHAGAGRFELHRKWACCTFPLLHVP